MFFDSGPELCFLDSFGSFFFISFIFVARTYTYQTPSSTDRWSCRCCNFDKIRPWDFAILTASSGGITPSISPSAPMTRTSRANLIVFADVIDSAGTACCHLVYHVVVCRGKEIKIYLPFLTNWPVASSFYCFQLEIKALSATTTCLGIRFKNLKPPPTILLE